MFSKDSILFQVNIFSKVLGVIIFIIGLVLLHNPALLVLLGIGLLILSSKYKYLFRYSIFMTLIVILSSFYPHFLWISKILIFINYVLLLGKITYSKDLRYLLEKTLYKFQNKKITYKVLYYIYIFKYMKKNYKLLNQLINEYGLRKDFNLYKFLHEQAFIKSKNEMKETTTMVDLRFYNYSNKRTYIDKPTWERWDTKYLLFYILVLIFIIIYGR